MPCILHMQLPDLPELGEGGLLLSLTDGETEVQEGGSQWPQASQQQGTEWGSGARL